MSNSYTPSFRICPSLGNQLANQSIHQSKSTNQPTTQHHFSPAAADSAALDHSLMVPMVPMAQAIQSQIPRSQKGSIQTVKNRKAKSPQFHEWAKTEPYHFFELPVLNFFYFSKWVLSAGFVLFFSEEKQHLVIETF